MSRALEATAPGKLVLLGEYTVLFGAPALVMAIDRRARVVLEPSSDTRWHAESPGLVPGRAAFEVGPDGGVRWEDPGAAEGLALVTGLFRDLSRTGLLDPAGLPPQILILDTRAFFGGDIPGRPKLGLGSSAALTVALAAGLLDLAGDGNVPGPGTILGPLVEAHRGLQGGRGSGIDVAASLLGGVLRYELDSRGSQPHAVPVSLPPELRLRFVWTGRAASTGGFLSRLERSLVLRETGTVACLDELGKLSARGLDELAGDRLPDFLDTVRSFTGTLERLGALMGSPILSPEHRRLRELASEAGVAYKPSGAGGGDFGIVFGTEEDRLGRFTRAASLEGFRPTTLREDPVGAVCSADSPVPSKPTDV